MTDAPQGDEEPEPKPGGPPSPLDPFAGFDLSQVMRLLQSTGPVNWEVAGQVGAWVAQQGAAGAPVTSDDRDRLEELARAAQTHVVGETGLAATFVTPVRALDRVAWVNLHLDALRPVLEALAGSLAEALRSELGDQPEIEPGELPAGIPFPFPTDPDAMVGMLAPVLLGLQAGSMVGYLAQHALGRYDLPLPTADAPSLCFVVPNLAQFEQEWSLPSDDVRFYVALHEVIHAAQRSVPWVQERLVELAKEYVAGYRVDPHTIEQRFGDVDPSDPASLQQLATDPAGLLGAIQSPEQEDALRRLQTLVSVLEGYADSVLTRVGRRLLPDFDRLHEAARRARLEQGEAGRFIEGLLGLHLAREHYERGDAFCAGVIERAGAQGLNRLWEGEAMLPTPAELEAPGLWLARIELPRDQEP